MWSVHAEPAARSQGAALDEEESHHSRAQGPQLGKFVSLLREIVTVVYSGRVQYVN